MTNGLDDGRLLKSLAQITGLLGRPGALLRISGRVSAISASGISVRGLSTAVKVDDFVAMETEHGRVVAAVMSIERDRIIVKPLQNVHHAAIGSTVEVIGAMSFYPCDAWKGRVISALAEPMDGLGTFHGAPTKPA